MKWTVANVEPIEGGAGHRFTVRLDPELAEILGRHDPVALIGLTFDFGAHMSEAAALSAIRNEINARKIKGAALNKFAHLIGKSFDL